jgi:ribosomal protein S18 acetylase RimI-like enzyme
MSKIQNIKIEKAQSADVSQIADLFLSLFPYVFRDIFETSDHVIHKMLVRLSYFNKGKNYYGFSSIYLARNAEDNKISGFISLTDKGTNNFFTTIRWILYLIFLVISFNGFQGLTRFIRNAFNNRKSNPEILRDELYISYIGVLPDYQRKGIAEEMILYALQLAKMKGKKRIGLDVRQDNQGAILLFLKMGFREVRRIKDGAFNKPERITMRKEVS